MGLLDPPALTKVQFDNGIAQLKNDLVTGLPWEPAKTVTWQGKFAEFNLQANPKSLTTSEANMFSFTVTEDMMVSASDADDENPLGCQTGLEIWFSAEMSTLAATNSFNIYSQLYINGTTSAYDAGQSIAGHALSGLNTVRYSFSRAVPGPISVGDVISITAYGASTGWTSGAPRMDWYAYQTFPIRIGTNRKSDNNYTSLLRGVSGSQSGNPNPQTTLAIVPGFSYGSGAGANTPKMFDNGSLRDVTSGGTTYSLITGPVGSYLGNNISGLLQTGGVDLSLSTYLKTAATIANTKLDYISFPTSLTFERAWIPT